MDIRQLKREIDSLSKSTSKIDYVFKPEKYLYLLLELLAQVEDLEEKLHKTQKDIKEIEKGFKSEIKTLEEKSRSMALSLRKTQASTTRYR